MNEISKEKRIVFLGTPKIAALFLEKLILDNYNIVGVISKPDKPTNRGNKVEPSEVSKVAIKHQIPLHRPVKLNKDYEFVANLKPDLILTFAFGQILSTKVLELSKFPPLNIHTSLLPKYRGSNPIMYSLLNGDEVTGVTIIKMIKEMDAGQIYGQVNINIDKEDNLSSLSNKMVDYAYDLFTSICDDFFQEKIITKDQNEDEVTFTKMVTKEDEHISLNLGCTEFINYVRAFSYDIGCYLLLNGEPLKIFKASKYDDSTSYEVGTLIKAKKKELLLQLKDGVINLLEVQKPNKKIMTNVEFNNGARNIEMTVLE